MPLTLDYGALMQIDGLTPNPPAVTFTQDGELTRFRMKIRLSHTTFTAPSAVQKVDLGSLNVHPVRICAVYADTTTNYAWTSESQQHGGLSLEVGGHTEEGNGIDDGFLIAHDVATPLSNSLPRGTRGSHLGPFLNGDFYTQGGYVPGWRGANGRFLWVTLRAVGQGEVLGDGTTTKLAQGSTDLYVILELLR